MEDCALSQTVKLDAYWVQLAALVSDAVAHSLARNPPLVSPWVNSADAAKYLAVKPKTLENQRRSGTGPKCRLIGTRTIRYNVADLDAWVLSGIERGPGVRQKKP